MILFSDFIGIIIFTPLFIFVSLYGVIAVYKIFDSDI